MRPNNLARFVLVTLFLLTSCNLGITNPPVNNPPAVPVIIDETTSMSEPTSVPELTAENIFSFDGMNISVGFNYPDGFEQGSINELVPKADEPSAPYEPAYPQHARILFTTAGNPTQNGIRIFRTDEMNAVDSTVVESLKAVLAGQLDQRTDFPRLAGAGRMIDAQAVALPFQNGNGFRFLILTKFDASSLGGTSMTYMYQGLTKDGQYIVTFMTSVDAPFLADLVTNQAFTSNEEATSYTKQVNDRLNAADPSQFNPPLTALDELSASIIVIQK